jgi:hypothetical protein
MRSNTIQLIAVWSALACGSGASSLEVANLYADDVITAIFLMKAGRQASACRRWSNTIGRGSI